MNRKFLIGTLGITASMGLIVNPRLFSKAFCSSSEELEAFSKKEFRKFKIVDIKQVSPNTKVLLSPIFLLVLCIYLVLCGQEFHVALPSPNHVTGMSTASCIMIKGLPGADNKDVARPYTPISLNCKCC